LQVRRAKKKLCKKKRGKKVSRSAERDSGLCPENPRAFEKARPKLLNRLRRKLKVKRIDWCVTLLAAKSRASRRFEVSEASPNG